MNIRIVRANSGVLYVVTVTQPATEQVVFQRLHVKRHIAGVAIRVEMSIDHAQEQRMSHRFNNLDRAVPELRHAFYRRPSRFGTRRWRSLRLVQNLKKFFKLRRSNDAFDLKSQKIRAISLQPAISPRRFRGSPTQHYRRAYPGLESTAGREKIAHSSANAALQDEQAQNRQAGLKRHLFASLISGSNSILQPAIISIPLIRLLQSFLNGQRRRKAELLPRFFTGTNPVVLPQLVDLVKIQQRRFAGNFCA